MEAGTDLDANTGHRLGSEIVEEVEEESESGSGGGDGWVAGGSDDEETEPSTLSSD